MRLGRKARPCAKAPKKIWELAVSADLLSHPSLRAYIAKCEAAAAPVRKLQAH